MAGNKDIDGSKHTRKSEFETLSPAQQQRIRRTLKLAGFWFGGVLLSAVAFVIAKPFIKKWRLEQTRFNFPEPRSIKPGESTSSSKPGD